MKAILVGYGSVKEFEVEELKKYYEVIGLSADYSKERKEGLCVPRKELDNQPLLKGFIGPMWDGGKLRYETQDVYEKLSD